MITLLAAITGFISSIIPEILKIYKDINDKKHEINILDRQIANNKNLISLKLLQSLSYHKKWQSNILFTPLINQVLVELML
ncbi:hypothetical protein [Rickettsia conorii]|uniref:hypothetical protein n=1 Tax=Rickettsia conorii TaxID=781 RepID=UPI000302E2FE|nr:hypothetical protein [Rickettsia conorii]